MITFSPTRRMDFVLIEGIFGNLFYPAGGILRRYETRVRWRKCCPIWAVEAGLRKAF